MSYSRAWICVDEHTLRFSYNKQKENFNEIITRVEKGIPYHFVIIGRAGTGKSKLLKAINLWIDSYHSNMRGNNSNSAS